MTSLVASPIALLRRAAGAALRFQRFQRDFAAFAALSRQSDGRFTPRWEDRLPCLNDRTPDTAFDKQYLYHPAWAARVLSETRPAEHTDISSILYFSALVSAFLPVRFYDYRPAAITLDGLAVGRADLTALPFETGSVASLSCMHTVEHIGLGRYGDPLDPEGDLKAMRELDRVLAPGGSLLFAVPVGRPRLLFNGHRIYSFAQIRDAFAGLELAEFSLILDDAHAGGLVRNADPALADEQTYGCGCFHFKKRG